MVIQHVRRMFGKVLQGDRHGVAAAQYMRQITFRGNNGLPWKQEQQEDQDGGFHFAQDIAACIYAQCAVGEERSSLSEGARLLMSVQAADRCIVRSTSFRVLTGAPDSLVDAG